MRFVGVCTLAAILCAMAPTYAANSGAKYEAARTEFGHPDLQGVWNFSSDVPLERPAAFADKEYFTRQDLDKLNAARDKAIEHFSSIGVGAHDTTYFDYAARTENLRTSLIMYPANGRMPKLVAGVTAVSEFDGVFTDAKGTYPVRIFSGGVGKDGPEQRGLAERCLTFGGLPLTPSFENNFVQIYQSKDHVIVLLEQIHDARIIPLDGRPFLDARPRAWNGESRGRWEGDTLVVVTKNFSDLTPSFRGAGTAYHKVVTERFTRTSADTLRYEATIEDPATFDDKIVVSFPMAKSAARVFEFACHEGNYALAGMLAGARKEERDAAAQASKESKK